MDLSSEASALLKEVKALGPLTQDQEECALSAGASFKLMPAAYWLMTDVHGG